MSRSENGSTSGSQLSRDSLSSQAGHRRKYHGLLKRSALKNVRDDLFRFLDYVGTMAPSQRSLMSFMMYLTSTIMVIMGCIPQSALFWDRQNLVGVLMNIISVCGFIAPPSLDQKTFSIVAILVEAIIIAICLVIVASFVVFLRMSKFPDFMVSFVSWFLNGALPLVTLIMGGYVGRAIAGIWREDGSVVLNTICVVFGGAITFVVTALQRYFITPSLAFRPQAFIFVMGSHMMRFQSLCWCFAVFCALGGRLDDGWGGIFILLGCLVMIANIVTMFIYIYGVGSLDTLKMNIGFMGTAAVMSMVFGVMKFVGMKAGESAFVIIMAIFLLCHLANSYAMKAIGRMIAELSDQAINDMEYFDTLPEPKALIACRFAFETGAEIAHRWIMFEHMHRMYPTSIAANLLFARYAAIYSDETPALRLAAKRVRDLKHNNLEMKRVLFEIFSVMQQREASMSVSIKKALYKISQKIEKERGQIRYLWECVIRGNVEELEELSVHLKSLEAEIIRDYNQLCLVYPNNPYVAHSYSAFLGELVNNDDAAAEMKYTYQMLRMGKRTRVERCYFFGSRFFPSLPSDEQHAMLARAETHVSAQPTVIEQSVSVQSTQQDQFFDNNAQIDEKMQRKYVENMIDAVRLPSMKYGPLIVVMIMVILMPVCIMPITVMVLSDIGTVKEAMMVVRDTALMRFQFVEMILLTYQLAFYKTGVTRMPSMKERWEKTYGQYYDLPMDWESDIQCQRASLMKTRDIVNKLNTDAPHLAQYEAFDEAIQILYSPILEFRVYSSHNDYTEDYYSLEHIAVYLMNIAVRAGTVEDASEFVDQFQFWSLIKGVRPMMTHSEKFASAVLRGIVAMISETEGSIVAQALLAILLPYALAILFNIFLIIRLEKEKLQIFSSFKALPKSALSAIVQHLNHQGDKEEGEEDEGAKVEASAQEENALRLLSTSVDSGFGWIGRSWQIIALLVIFTIAAVVAIVVLVFFTGELRSTFDQINPLFMEVPRQTTLLEAITLTLLRLAAAGEFPEGATSKLPDNARANYTLTIEELDYFMEQMVDTINNLRIASGTTNATGMSVGGTDFIELLTQPPCRSSSFELSSVLDILVCTSFESSASFLLQRIWQLYYLVHLQEEGEITVPYDTLTFDMETMNILMSWILGFSRDVFLDPAMKYLEDLVGSETRRMTIECILVPIIICVIVMMVTGIALIPNYMRTAEGARWSLRLLLFCQPSIVLQSKPIVKILSNDFSENEEQKDQGGANFYETVVSNLLDGVLFLSNSLEIMSANHAVTSVLGVDPESIIGKNLLDIFVAPDGRDSSLKAFKAAILGALKSQRSPCIEAEVEIMRNDDCVTLGLSMTAISSSGHVQLKATNAEGIAVLALVMKDMTATIASNKLLVEEGIKSEKLLLMILPPIIVHKLQSGEKNISFAVKSASIMFVDIVSFTPWCGSHPADYVMATLNRLFLEFDRILKKYDRMTKIKCIGDCYMCAGGIFDEINQPAEHTKQTISFGIDIIRAVQLLNIELNESLRIRVGVNTGGPIVAGVLGIDKPTFDILGPDICLAAMMEHHGVPMHVHIPQHCYDLVYGNYFRIKERGDVEVKGKVYHTYVVSGYDQGE